MLGYFLQYYRREPSTVVLHNVYAPTWLHRGFEANVIDRKLLVRSYIGGKHIYVLYFFLMFVWGTSCEGRTMCQAAAVLRQFIRNRLPALLTHFSRSIAHTYTTYTYTYSLPYRTCPRWYVIWAQPSVITPWRVRLFVRKKQSLYQRVCAAMFQFQFQFISVYKTAFVLQCANRRW